MEKNKAFTIIELLVVIAVMLIFIGMTLAQYNNFTEQTKLKNEGKKLVDIMELAKKKSLSSDLEDKNCTDFNGYRVTISSGSYSLLFGCNSTYSVVQNYSLPPKITVTTGTGDYDFTPLMINPIFVSDLINLNNSVINKTISLSVSPVGLVELEGTPIVEPSSPLLISCTSICIDNGMVTGTCRTAPSKCTTNHETHVSSGDQYCTVDTHDTCCCK